MIIGAETQDVEGDTLPKGRAVLGRLAISVLLFVMIMAGTLMGTADHFPFAPFTQYAGDVQPGEPFTTYELWSGYGSPDPVRLSYGGFGVRPAELSRQLNHFRVDADEAASLLVEAYEARNGSPFPHKALDIVRVSHLVETGHVTRLDEEATGRWER